MCSTPPTNSSRETADNQARCSMNAIFLTLSDSHIGQAQLEPRCTCERISTDRKRASRDAKNNRTASLVPKRNKTQTLLGLRKTNKCTKAEKGNGAHVEQAEHSKPSRASKADCELSGITGKISPLSCPTSHVLCLMCFALRLASHVLRLLSRLQRLNVSCPLFTSCVVSFWSSVFCPQSHVLCFCVLGSQVQGHPVWGFRSHV